MGTRSSLRHPLLGLVLPVLLLHAASVLSQIPNIRISQPGSDDPEEVTIAINPTDPLNLAAGANIDYTFVSFDGGLTWTEDNLSSPLGVWGDPCVAFDAEGDLYYCHLSAPQSGSWLDRIVVQKSIDGGMSWDDGTGVGLNPPRDQDKEWMAVDMTPSPWHNNLYLAWTEFDAYGSSNPADSTRILFSRSLDSGQTWSSPVRISDTAGDALDGDDTVEGAVPAVGPNGEVYVSWAGPLGIMFDRSLDGGVTFGQDVFVTDQPGGWDFGVSGIYRANGLPVTACDISGSPYRGTIYVMWSDQRNGTSDTDVFLIKSTDGGQSWGGMVTVNDDAGASQQFFPWLAVDPATGIIYVVFYDRRNTTGNGTEVWMARSDDGGASFANFLVSESPFVPSSAIFFGDYINIAARGGRVYPIWMRMDGAALSVWCALYVDEIVGIPLPPAAMASPDIVLLPSAPNPFNPTTTLAFQLARPGLADLSVYDVQGRHLETLLHRVLADGAHRLTWNAAHLGSGVYFCRLTANGQAAVQECLLVK